LSFNLQLLVFANDLIRSEVAENEKSEKDFFETAKSRITSILQKKFLLYMIQVLIETGKI